MYQPGQYQKMRYIGVLLLVTVIAYAVIISPIYNANCAYAGVSPGENEDITEVGDVFQWLLPALALGSTFVVRGPDGKLWDKEGTWQYAKSGGSTIITTQILKNVAGKFRPGTFVGKGTSNKSFPSGHTSAAFSGAAFINTRYGSWFGVPSYAAALFTAYSRVQADAHFIDDVTAGASIALLYNWLWATPQSWSGDFAIMPLVTDEATGVQVMVKMGNDTQSESIVKKPKKKAPRYRFNFGFGPAFLEKNEITSPSSTGTTFNLANFENADDVLTTAAVEFDIFLGKRHTVSLFWLPYENRDIGSFSSPVSFAGQNYPANTSITSAWRQNEIKGVYHYNLTPEMNWQFQVGGGLAVQHTNIALQTQDLSIKSEVDDWVVLPILHGAVDYKFTPKWTFSVWADGIYLSEDTYLDAVAAINYQISHHWDVSLGYEYYNRNIETSELKNHTILNIPFIAVAYSW